MSNRANPVAITSGILIAALMTGAALGACSVLGRRNINKRVAQARADELSIATALVSFFVDDCSGLNPGHDNYLPIHLTTPTPYLKTLPKDPFSKSGETYRYFNQIEAGNSTLFLLVSQGPDHDWDVDRLPGRYSPRELVNVPKGSSYKYAQYDKPNIANPDLRWVANVEYYITPGGERVNTPTYELKVIPKEGRDQQWVGVPQLIDHLAANGIFQYDPSNGLVSDGDIIRLRN